jgi:hypothetical protein
MRFDCFRGGINLVSVSSSSSSSSIVFAEEPHQQKKNSWASEFPQKEWKAAENVGRSICP